ncbi:MurR/RpiR family transcriptional regulator [Propionivibrio soli]|jgi:DNA-binding MurR/RpiR family transcriptional regulator|uniref:MurR/RpiR family transcriptional regulator n=1 Tax=Propionivibrio soli TaxID=2976531 RepID=UPI0021E7249B|nr:MurR/RpiR family transcriptional regulator [Propionivibrio soli]
MNQDSRVEDLVQRVAQEYDGLSKQLKLIAKYVTENRQHMVVVRIRDVADACGVQPSAVVRFAQHFGFSGFSDLQAVFRDAYASGVSVGNYQQRIRAVISKHPAQMKSPDLARSFLETCQSGIASISATLDDRAFEKAVGILQGAQHIYIMGVRRMFPVASYLAYVLPQTRKRVILVDAMGGMFKEQIEGLSKGDVLLSISMSPYGTETRYCTELAVERQATVVAITDSSLSPISRAAAVTLTVQEAEAYYFRAMAGTMSLAQALFIALAYRLELNMERSDERTSAD